jgi:dephospho-CoA kinase
MTIIGVAGPAGAGKDTVSDLLESDYGYTHLSGGDTIRAMLRSLDLDPNKLAVVAFGMFLRAHYGGGVVLDRALKATGAQKVIYSGFRSPGEAKATQSFGGRIIYVDAPFELRHRRIIARARPGEDTSVKAMRSRENFEKVGTSDDQENLPLIRTRADFILENDGNVQELKKKLADIMSTFNG